MKQKPDNATGAKPTEKKRYQAPEIVSREKLEFVAAVCEPSPPAKADFATCPSGPANS